MAMTTQEKLAELDDALYAEAGTMTVVDLKYVLGLLDRMTMTVLRALADEARSEAHDQ